MVGRILHMNILNCAPLTRRVVHAFYSLPFACGLVMCAAPAGATEAGASAKILNFSGRAQVASGANVLITGFVVSEGATKTILIRAVGPGLAAFGMNGALAEPTIALFAGPRQVLSNTRWN